MVSPERCGQNSVYVISCLEHFSILGTLQGLTVSKSADSEFMYQYLLGFDFGRFAVGSTIPYVYYRDYGQVEISLPCPEEQGKSVSALSVADAKVAAVTDQVTLRRPSRARSCSRCSCKALTPRQTKHTGRGPSPGASTFTVGAGPGGRPFRLIVFSVYWIGRMTISTRRFCARPSGVRLVAMGASSPAPMVAIRAGDTPAPVSTLATESARRLDRARL